MCQVLKIFSILIGVAIVAPASAQPAPDILAEFQICRALKNDAQRLKCFDKLVLADQLSDQAARKNTAWTIEESTSPLNDSPQVSGFLIGADGETSLVLRCKDKKTEVIFSTTKYRWSDTVRILARFGDGKLIETKWNVATSRGAVFAPNPVQFIQALPQNGKLSLKAIDSDGARGEGVFNLGDVSEIRKKIAVACQWPVG